MKKVVRLTEADLASIVKRVIKEQAPTDVYNPSSMGRVSGEPRMDKPKSNEFDWKSHFDQIKNELDSYLDTIEGPVNVKRFQSKVTNAYYRMVSNVDDEYSYPSHGDNFIQLTDEYMSYFRNKLKNLVQKYGKLTESDLVRLVKRIINEQSTNPVCNRFVMNVPLKNPDPDTGLNLSKNKVLVYSAIYQEPMSGGKLNATDGGGNKVWLQSKGFSDWPAGNTKLAYTAAKKLYDGISGLDISGEGAKKIAEVAQMWKSFDILTQNEFLKQWYKLTQGSETPWEAIASDNEEKFRDMMVNDSTSKVKKYCPASVYY